MSTTNWRRGFLTLFVLATLVIAVLALPGGLLAKATAEESAPAKIEPLVLQELAADGQTEFFVWMTEKADLSPAYQLQTKEEKGLFVFNALTATAARTQRDLRNYLDGQGIEYQSFYIANKILVRGGSEALVLDLAGRADVAKITANHAFQLPEPMINLDAPESPTTIEPNISFVNADDVWALGYDGEGIVLAGNDTGLYWNHPALINQYRGWDGATANHNYNWWDATGTYPSVPGDGHGHGTHTSGTMVGDDGAGNQIGMAPGASLVHCKNMTDGGSGDDGTFSECFQWDLAPWDLTGANPNPLLAPHAINNSWGYWGGNAPQFEDEITALRAAGIVVEVSAGNEGPSCTTLRSPSDYSQSLTTGSVNHTSAFPGSLTGFSSRGPSLLYPNDFMPDIMAPGENIRSSIPGGSFQGGWSGTSMSGPHVTGLIALMWSASPGIIGDVATTEQLIIDTAVPLTGQTGSNCGGDYTVGPNNDWGFGTIDSLAAVQAGIVAGGPFRLEANPDSLAVCTPDSAVYDIQVLLNEVGFSQSVNLEAYGEPAGTSVSFVPDNQAPPYTSTMTVGNMASAAAGNYSIDVVGSATTQTMTTTVGLDVYTAIPGAVTLLTPANGATNIDLVPTFTWSAATQGGLYDLEVASDSGFGTIVYASTVAGTSDTSGVALSPLTTYYWRVMASNPCGDGATSATFSFTTRDIPPILLVDDDDNSPDVQAIYTSGLDAIGAQYDIWDTVNSDTEPSALDLAPYTTVIWFTGVSFGGAAGPGGAGETALGTWLDSGNCLFISGQDYYYDRGMTTFMTNYLGAATIANDTGDYTAVTGQGTVFGGLGPYSLTYPFSDYSDPITPDATAELGMLGDNGNGAGINKDSGVYRTAFWVFPWEAITNAVDRETSLQSVLNWCGTGATVGTLQGNVSSLDTGLGLDGATVTSVDGGYQRIVHTNASGDYSVVLPIGTYDVTADAANYVSVTVNSLVIVTSTITTQDFVLDGSVLSYSPDSLDETMDIGDVVSNTVTVTNTGPLPIDWTANIGNFGGPVVQVRPVAIHIPASDGNFERGTAAPSIGAAPVTGQSKVAGSSLEALLGSMAYSIETANGYFTAFDLDVPAVLPNLGPYSTISFPGAGDVIDGYAYVIDGTTMFQLDLATGAVVSSMSVTPPSGSQSYTGMALDPTTGDVYVSSCDIATSILYSLDMDTGVLTQIGTITNSPCTIAIAVDGSGALYGHDIVSDVLLSIDKNSGAGTVIGSLGFDANYGQGMGWDPATDQIYLAAFNLTSFAAELRIADRNTGNTALVGALGSTTPGGTTQLPWLGMELGPAVQPWAFAAPDSSTIPANSVATFEVVFDARSLYQTGDYTADLSFDGTFVNTVADMPLTMHLGCPTCGYLDGAITDAWTSLPLAASIHITSTLGFDVTLSGDSYALAVQPGTYYFTVSASGYFDAVDMATVTQGATTTTDFALIPQAALLEYAPDDIEEWMEVGDIVTNTVTVTNTGTIPLDFTVDINNTGAPSVQVRPVAIHIPASDGNFERGTAAPSIGAAPITEQSKVAGSSLEALLGSMAYSIEAANGYFTAFDLDAPDVLPNLGPYSTISFPGAGDVIDGYAYVIDGTTMFQLDLATGAVVSSMSVTPPPGSQSYSGMALDPTTGDVYVSSCDIASSILFDLDIDTGVLTQIGTITNSPCTIAIAIDGSGTMYGHDIVSDVLLSIDKNSGAGTVIGSLGFDANYGQGMGWDPATDQIYLAAFNLTSFAAELRIADRNTGNTALVGTLGSTTPGGTAQLPWLGMELGPAVSPWAYAVPDYGTVPAGAAITFEVVFDARSVTLAGDYTADLSFGGNFINTVADMPLAMHLTCPTCGYLNGSITDAWTSAPLNADIDIQGAGGFLYSGSGDAYDLTVPADVYNITVSANGYFSETAVVTVTVAQTTTQDFALTPIIALVDYQPDAYEVYVGIGTMVTQTLNIDNVGTWGFDFTLSDVETGTPFGAVAQSPATTCPSDAFGYTCTDSTEADGLVTYNFEDISGTGTAVTLSDDSVSNAIPLGFSFNYYGLDYTDLYISSNGFLTLLAGQPNGCCSGQPIPTSATPNAVIAGWWEDMNPGSGGTIQYEVMGTQPQRYMIVQFTDVPHYGGGNNVTLQYKLFEGSNNIEVHYATAPSDGGTHSAGIESDTGTDGLQYYLGIANLADSLAVCYLYPGQFACGSGGVDAPWLWETPDAGTVNAGESVAVDIVFDATTITTTGTYTAEIYLNGTFANATTPIVAVMHVEQPMADITLDVTLSTDGSCGVTDTLSVLAGSTVYYCYTVTNTGNVMLPSHTITDTFFGNISTFTYDLQPGMSESVIVPQVISGDVASTATWQAAHAGLGMTASASDSATVTLQMQYIYLPVVVKP